MHAGIRLLAFGAAMLIAGSANAAGPVQHKSLYTILNSGTGTAIPAAGGQTTIYSATVNCPNTAGCTVEMDAMAQAFFASATPFAICNMIDGAVVSPGCYWQPPTTSQSQVARVWHNRQIATGTHTVETYVTSGDTGSITYWQIAYRVYKP